MIDQAQVEQLFERFQRGDRRALARSITWVENGGGEAAALIQKVYPLTGRAQIIGITGPPGAGKSTLVDRLAVEFRQRSKSVAIVAVDPTSPFSGGAILGDRIRMQRTLNDPGVFMRSLASRGHLGGLSIATGDVVTLLDGFGFDVILVETVGAGQSEVEIMELAHTTCVVVIPGMGDEIQAIKAGILEIGDLFACNKSDREGADRTVNEIQMMLDLGHMGEPGINRWPTEGQGANGSVAGTGVGTGAGSETGAAGPTGGGNLPAGATGQGGHSAAALGRLDRTGHHSSAELGNVASYMTQAAAHAAERHGSANPGDTSWRPPVVKTVAKDNQGVAALVDRMEEHLHFLRETGRWELRKRQDAAIRLRELVSKQVARLLWERARTAGDDERLSQAVAERRLDPYTAAAEILGKHWGQ